MVRLPGPNDGIPAWLFALALVALAAFFVVYARLAIEGLSV